VTTTVGWGLTNVVVGIWWLVGVVPSCAAGWIPRPNSPRVLL
jgi:hypothetical protein